MVIRLAPSCFQNSIIFVSVGVPKILSRTLKGMIVMVSLGENLTMVAKSSNWWECGVRGFLSRSASCWYTT